ncbi:ABC transporter permease [Actinomadura keratinilytica]|uniref:ABC transporter permease n=1 Tax=Actinomadura keratinilytica TaxID=547461 RepID=A0ABP7YIF1_9ACTN
MTAAVTAGAVRARRAPTRPGLWAAALFLGLVVLAALAPGLFTDGSAVDGDPAAALTPPGADHVFGTDANGRDVFTRIVHGARPSLLVGLGATALAVAGGTVLGLVAALGGRWLDELVMRLVDVVLALPSLLLALVVLVVAGPGTLNSVCAVGVAAVPVYARLVRVRAMVVRGSGYVEAATALGLPRAVVIVRHVLPNVLAPLLVLATIEVGTALVAVASLGFLGFGPQPPAPEWGAMLAAGRDYTAVAWWVAVFPGLAITLTVLSITVVGRALRRRGEGRDA